MAEDSLPPPRQDLGDIRLYHGSLDELNTICANTGFKCVLGTELTFVYISDEKHLIDAERETKRELVKIGYRGLVNRRTAVIPIVSGHKGRDGIVPVTDISYIIEGTPFNLVRHTEFR